MENISPRARLKESILLLESERSVHFQEMRANFFLAYENLKPANIIETTIKEIVSSPFLLNNAFNVALGVVTGYLSRKALMTGRSNKKSGKLLGLILQLGVTNLIVYAPDAVKSLFSNILSKSEKKS